MAKAALMDFDEALSRFEPVLGFEVHVELNTRPRCSRLRRTRRTPATTARSPTRSSPRSTSVCPGSLPVVNEQAVRYSISLGLALGCSIAPSSRFARKNYFYPDLGKNYQISQYDEPIAFEGSVEVELADGTTVTVPIERAHMEEDAGKLTHVGGSTGRIQGAEYSLVDYNRAGVPLVEIVTQARSSAPSTARPRSRRRTSRRSATSCSASASRTPGWSAATCAATRTCRCVRARQGARSTARHAHRDEERQLDALRRACRALRDPAAGGDPRRRRHDHAGDAALARGHRHDLAGSPEVGCRRLPLLPRARPAARRAVARADRRAARRAARAAGRASSPAEGGLGLHRPRVPGRRQRRPARRGRGDGRGGRDARRRAQVVDGRDHPRRERDRPRGRRARDAGGCRRAAVARRRGHAHRQARPPGARGRHRRRGHPAGGRRRPRSRRRLRRRRAHRGHRRGARRRSPTCSRRSATARCRPPARSSAP